MDIEYWKRKSDELFAKAIDIMTDHAIDEFIDFSDFANATDLQECDGDEIQLYYDILSGNVHCPEEDEPFSIKEFIESHHGMTYFPLFEQYVKQNWEECLDDDLIEAIEDRIKVGMIVDKYCLGGGGFEVERDLQIGVRDRIAEKIKERFKSGAKI